MSRVCVGDLVFTYDFRLTQVKEIEYSDNKPTGYILNTGEIVDTYEVVKIKWIGSKAMQVLKKMGKCMI